MITTNNLFFWDIETAGKHKDFSTFKQQDSRGAELFEYKVKRKQKQNPNDVQWTGTVDECYLKNSPLLAEYGRIVCISYAYYNNGELKIGSIKNIDEELLVKEAHRVFSQVAKLNRRLCGYNIKGFDMPWLFKKMITYKLLPPFNLNLFEKKPWDITCLDLMELWKGIGYEASTFDEFTYAINVKSPKSDMDGTMVHSYFHDGRINEIVKYCEADVNALVESANYISSIE